MDKKIFIYEDSKGFSSLLKRYYSNKVIIDSSKDKNFIAHNYGDYQACFFMINNVRDYIIFEKVLNKIKDIGWVSVDSKDSYIHVEIERFYLNEY